MQPINFSTPSTIELENRSPVPQSGVTEKENPDAPFQQVASGSITTRRFRLGCDAHTAILAATAPRAKGSRNGRNI